MNSAKICFVDDDENILEIYSELAEMNQWNSVCYSSAAEYIADIGGDEDGSMLVLDLSMPGMDGFEVMKYFSAAAIVPSLLLVSGFDEGLLNSALKLSKAYGFEAVDIMTKPVDLALLKNKVDVFLLEKAI